jgi:peptidoglycan/LPS O-acetylase OafA/YrhL
MHPSDIPDAAASIRSPSRGTSLHLPEIDWLRSLACVAVVAFHFCYRGQQSDWIADAPPRWLAMPLRYGYLGVDLFFIVSGFVVYMTASGRSPRAFVASRIARLFPAYWAAVLLTAVVCTLSGSEVFAVSWTEVLVNLSMLTHLVALRWEMPFVDGAYWSLGVEVQFYLLVWLALCLDLLESCEVLAGGWLMMSAISLVRPMFNLGVWLGLEWAPLFTAGILFYRILLHGLTLRRYLLVWAAYWLAVAQAIRPAVLMISAPGDPPRDPWVVFAVLSVFFGLFALLALRRLRWRGYRWIRWAGLLTYPVYVLHQNIGYVLLEVLRPVWPSLAIRLLVGITLILLLATLVHRLIERPLGVRLRRLILGQPCPPARVTAHQPSP